VSVQSSPLSSRPRTSGGPAIFLGKVGMWLTVASFGGIFWAVNGGFSVIGLGVMASAFNSAGRLFWAAVSSITFPVPVQVAGLPATQPLIPWIGVVAASLLQISISWLKLSGRSIPVPLLVTTILVSIYDYVTTVFGLGTVEWIALIGLPAQLLIAIPLTFCIETAIGFALKR
jgi:hypothetical protein